MATMYSLFFGFLFAAVCSDKDCRNSILNTFYAPKSPAKGDFFLLDQKEGKSQGCIPLCYSLSKNLSKTELTRYIGLKHHFALNGSCSKELSSRNTRRLFKASATVRTAVQLGLMSKVSCLSSMEGNNNNKTLRQSIIQIASKELGTREATGHNDGPHVAEYLAYTGLGQNHEWCASFISWSYGQAGLAQPRNPWSPALFPKARLIDKSRSQPADVFGIYGAKAKRIHHVGLVKELQGDYLVTIEGNSNNRVESRRRHLRTIRTVADWVK